MELIDVISLAHFDDPRVGAVSRKQRLRIPVNVAEHLVSLGVVQYVNPIPAAVIETPKIEPVLVGGDEPSTSLQPEPVSLDPTASLFRRGRRKKTSE